jgi:hypothetical protein
MLHPRARRWHTALTFENRGGAEAVNVRLDELVSVQNDQPILFPEFPGSIPSLLSGGSAAYTGNISNGLGDVFRANVSWDDPRGRQTRQLTVTRDRH